METGPLTAATELKEWKTQLKAEKRQRKAETVRLYLRRPHAALAPHYQRSQLVQAQDHSHHLRAAVELYQSSWSVCLLGDAGYDADTDEADSTASPVSPVFSCPHQFPLPARSVVVTPQSETTTEQQRAAAGVQGTWSLLDAGYEADTDSSGPPHLHFAARVVPPQPEAPHRRSTPCLTWGLMRWETLPYLNADYDRCAARVLL
jgi:hypothetical protein